MQTYSKDLDGGTHPEEDFSLFLQDLAEVMNKYHYGFHECKFVKFMDERIKITEFVGDGEFVYPMVDVPKDLLEKGDSE